MISRMTHQALTRGWQQWVAVRERAQATLDAVKLVVRRQTARFEALALKAWWRGSWTVKGHRKALRRWERVVVYFYRVDNLVPPPPSHDEVMEEIVRLHPVSPHPGGRGSSADGERRAHAEVDDVELYADPDADFGMSDNFLKSVMEDDVDEGVELETRSVTRSELRH